MSLQRLVTAVVHHVPRGHACPSQNDDLRKLHLDLETACNGYCQSNQPCNPSQRQAPACCSCSLDPGRHATSQLVVAPGTTHMLLRHMVILVLHAQHQLCCTASTCGHPQVDKHSIFFCWCTRQLWCLCTGIHMCKCNVCRVSGATCGAATCKSLCPTWSSLRAAASLWPTRTSCWAWPSSMLWSRSGASLGPWAGTSPTVLMMGTSASACASSECSWMKTRRCPSLLSQLWPASLHILHHCCQHTDQMLQ